MITTNIVNRRKQFDVSYIHLKTPKSLDIDVLRKSFEKAIISSEFLRTAFYWRGLKQPVGIVHKKVIPNVNVHKILNDVSDDIEAIKNLRRKEGFKLETPPLMCMDIFVKSDGTAEILIFYYTSLIDGWSMDKFLERLNMLYDGADTSKEDFNRQSYINLLNKKSFKENTVDYWKQHFGNFQCESKEKSYTQPIVNEINTNVFDITNEELKIVEKISHNYKLSKASILSFCYACALQQDSKPRDVIIAITSSGRNAEFEGMLDTIGIFSHITPLRVNCSEDELDVLKMINSDLLKQRNLQPLPIDDITKAVGIDTSILKKAINNHGLVFLNHSIVEQKGQFEVYEDYGFLALPLRSYITLGKNSNILITYSKEMYTEKDVLRLKEKFSETICHLRKKILKTEKGSDI
nr:condensation domain-containing protein [Anaeromonas gelatinilytica]